mgnify:FL=1
MKLFMKEHRLLIVVQMIQMVLMTGIFWLAGFRDVQLILYTIFLGLFLLCCYLLYHYVSRRQFYRRLQTPIRSLDETLETLDGTPISESLYQLLKSQYSVYQEQMMELKKKQEEHFIFMDRWVHQMKTPLSVIELMAKDLDEPASSSFREETDRLKTGLQMVLSMARLRSIERDFQIKKISLINLVKNVNNENKRLFIRNNIFPQIKEMTENITVESDEKWLFFILTQLIHNAVKYSQGKAQHINITLDVRDKRAILEIEDEGVGIPKEDIRRIFDAFYTGENGRRFRESTGVGLFLVKEVIDYLGHQIEVDSTVGKGSTFRIIF